MEAGRSRAKGLGGISACVAALVAALALTIAPAAQAATPALEFSSPGTPFPISFTATGGEVNARLGDFNRVVECTGSSGSGKVTGSQATFSSYTFTGCVAEVFGGGGVPMECSSEGADPNEIVSETIEAEPVYLDQAQHEVAMLLDPKGEGYMDFECEGTMIEAFGPFLAPVSPVNQMATSFTAVLTRPSGNSQAPTEYEDLNGEKQQAVPKAKVNGGKLDNSGVSLTFTIHTAVPLEIKATSREEVEAKERADQEAAAKKRQEEDAAKAAADKKHQEEEAAKAAAAKKLAEEQAAAKKLQEERQKQQAQAKKRAEKRTKALRQCRKVKTPQKRTRCEARVKKKYSVPKAHTMRAARF